MSVVRPLAWHRRRLLGGIRSWLLLIVSLGAFWTGLELVVRLVWAPWSFGESSLTGTWEGPLHARLGAAYHLYLDLEYLSPFGRQSRPSLTSQDFLQGTARLCSPQGVTYEYAVRGSADRAGETVRLVLAYGDPQLSALDLTLVGTWGGPMLALHPHKNPFDPDGTFRPARSYSSDDPDDSFGPAGLRKASAAEFATACRQLASR